uniref:Protein ZIP4 homolog n=1 Tax=Alexandrium monilatum TaxID=311494 RepID=A0A7S4V667_9DINO
MDSLACSLEDEPPQATSTSLEAFVSRLEVALAAGRALDVDPGTVEGIARGLPGASLPPLSVKRAGHRLWQVCATGATARTPLLSGPAAAGTRELACELIEMGMAQTGSWGAGDQFDLILQWAVTGKAWLDLEKHAAAVRCLSRSSAAWDSYSQDGHAAGAPEAEAERLVEAALQTQLWMSSAMAQTGSYDQAFIALSKAAGILKNSPALAEVSQGAFLAACREQAAVLRKRGSTRLAADALLLACTVLPVEGGSKGCRAQPERADLLRELALCHVELREHETAVLHAREALRLEAVDSSGHAKSLRALLSALCASGAAARGAPAAPAAAGRGSGGDDIGEAALSFVAHRRAKLADCLDMCRDLADRGLDATFLACLARLRGRLRGGGPGELGAVWLLGAQVLASRIEEAGPDGGEAAVDGLCELLDDVEAAEERPPQLAAQLSSLLWGLGEALCRSGRPLAATAWLHRALPLLGEEGHVAAGWRVLAACHFKAGEVDQARRCAETALAYDPADAHAATLLLLHAVVQGEADVAHGLLKRVRAQEFSFSAVQAAYLVQEMGKRPPSKLHLDCMELIWETSLEDPVSAQEAGIPPQRLLRLLLETCTASGEPAARLARYLGKAASVAGLPEADAAWCAELAWSRSSELMAEGQWADCTVLLERTHALLCCCGATAAAAQAECAAAIARSLLQQARKEGNEKDARDLRQRAVAWAERGRSGLHSRGCAAVSGREKAAADQALASLQFEALCLLGSPLLEGAPGEELLAVAAKERAVVARLARRAVEADNAVQATRCLRAYLRIAASEEDAGGAAAAAARRELAGLRASGGTPGDDDEEAVRACEEASRLLRSGAAAPGFPSQLPEKEALWLAAVTWNSGTELAAPPGNDGFAARRLRAGLDLFKAIGERAANGGDVKRLHARLEVALAACEVGQ